MMWCARSTKAAAGDGSSTSNDQDVEALRRRIAELEQRAEAERKAREAAEQRAEAERKAREAAEQHAEAAEQHAEAAEQRAEAERKAREAAEQLAKAQSRAREEERQRAEEEWQRAEQERQRAEAAEARARALDGLPVRECIKGAPMFAEPIRPAWGDPLLPHESKASTPASKRWWPLRPDDVFEWTDADFAATLDRADTILVVHEGVRVSLLKLVLDETKARDTISNIFQGIYPHKEREKAETELEDLLTRSVWEVIRHVMGKEGLAPDRYPASAHIRTVIATGGESNPIVKFPLQYKQFFELDRSIEAWLLEDGEDKPKLPAVLEDGEDEPELPKFDEALPAEITRIAQRSVRTVIELKPDALCPKRKLLTRDAESLAKNAAYGGNLFDYIKSPYFDPVFNPVAQVTTYAVLSRTRPVAICTGNKMTYGCVDILPAPEGQTSRPTVKITKKFEWAGLDARQPPLACRPGWSHWEVLIRFVLGFVGDWYIGAFPEEFKRDFKRRITHGDKGDDVDPGPGPDAGGAGGGSGSCKKSRSRDAKGKGESESPEPSGSGSGSGAKPSETYALKQLYWEDLWAPLRFAIPATHPVEVECTWKKLPGDAELLATGRMGPTYRQTLQGMDVVVKVLPYVVPREELDDERNVLPTKLRDEMRNEVRAYGKLESVQGEFVPKLLWYGAIVEGMADALATEYVGNARPGRRGALRALRAAHRCGVLHGDVAVRNFVRRASDGRVFLIDFGFARFRDELGDVEFRSRAAEERRQLRGLFKDPGARAAAKARVSAA